MSKNGKFITFEGPEGAGKSTQLRLLAEELRSRGFEVVTTREPGGTPLAELLRNILKTHQGTETLHPETELLLMEAARSQHAREVILPALERGAVVLCDRFYDSTTAYQGAARNIDTSLIAELNIFAAAFRKPDLTLILDLDIESGFRRAGKRQETAGEYDRFEAENRSFHSRVREGFHAIAAKEPQRVRIIDAEGTPEEVAARIRSAADELF
ncbi:MAG: dTMP kinase [Lentisphaeria bacterium]|nr:dTMP kinase [Lentisphaeria bacterium]